MADELGGTPNPTPVDAPASGTAGQGTEDATADVGSLKAKLEEYERKFEQQLREKNNLEDERRRRQELEQQLAMAQQGYGTAPATPTNPYAEQAELMRRNYLALQQSDDPRDQMLVASLAYQQRMEQELRFNAEMASIPQSEQKSVAERARALGISPSLALQAIKGERYDREREEFDTRRKKLDEEESARRKGRVDVTTTPIPARDFQQGDYKPSDYARDCEAAANGDDGARQRLADFDAGRIHIKYG